MTTCSVLARPQQLYRPDSGRKEHDYTTPEQTMAPLTLEDGAVVLNPRNMNEGQYYPASINGELFLYRRVGSEIEVYELAQ